MEIWWIATFAQNLNLIHLMVSEKCGLWMDGRPLHGINSADTVKQSYGKKFM